MSMEFCTNILRKVTQVRQARDNIPIGLSKIFIILNQYFTVEHKSSSLIFNMKNTNGTIEYPYSYDLSITAGIL